MTLTKGQREYYRRTAGRRCACSEPAVIHRCGDYICARCAAAETLQAGNERRQTRVGVRDKSHTKAWLHDPDDPRHYPFTAFVSELAGALVVRGHGTYRLPI